MPSLVAAFKHPLVICESNSILEYEKHFRSKLDSLGAPLTLSEYEAAIQTAQTKFTNLLSLVYPDSNLQSNALKMLERVNEALEELCILLENLTQHLQ